MRKITQSLVVLSLLLATGLVSCNNFGKSVKVEGTKAEVFYKEEATEADAKKLGEFLKANGYATNEKESSFQVMKQNGEYSVRIVYNKEFFEKNPAVENELKDLAAKISKEVFDGNKVTIMLADKHFKDFKTIPLQEPLIETGLAPAAPPAGPLEKDEFDHETRGDVNFHWKGIPDNESKIIADYIVQNGAFAGGTAHLYVTKEGDKYVLQFPVKEDYRTDPAIIAEIEKVSKEIRDNVFPNNPFTFQMTDEKLNSVKSFDY